MYRAILLEPESSGNIGFIARLAENFGIDEIVLVRPQCEIDDEAERYASHAKETLHSVRKVDELEPVLADMGVVLGTTGIKVTEENVLRSGVPPWDATRNISGETDVGILFGPEGKGLSNEELDLCDVVVHIPTTEEYSVMNLSHAAGVLFYELYNADRITDIAEGDSGNTMDGNASVWRQRRVLENLFKDAAETLNWNPDRAEKTVCAFRNVLGRAAVTDRELSLLLGWFRDVRDEIVDTDEAVEDIEDAVDA